MEREVRYCTTEDGVRIAYCVEGSGPPLVVFPIFVESFSFDGMFPLLPDVTAKFARHFSVIRYDIRGVGLSDRDVPDMSIHAQALDADAVIQDMGLKAVSMFAWGAAGTWAAQYATRHPGDVPALLLYNTYIRPKQANNPETMRAFAGLCRSNWQLASQLLADLGTREGTSDWPILLANLYRKSTDGESVARLLEEAIAEDPALNFEEFHAPTLIMQRVDDPVFTLEIGRSIAAEIPGARLIPLSNDAIFGGGEAFESAIGTAIAFLLEAHGIKDEPVAVSSPQSAFRAVLFTDLVGHTEMMSRLGDERGRAVLREHEDITRNVLKQHGGTEVKTMGDGFMASFGSVTKAVECAIALQQAFAEREGEPLSVRVGLNAGEPIEEDGDLFGATVILASRISAKAEGGEILVADTVRGLCSGKGFLFADRGDFVAKGFEEPVRVYEVSWRH